MNRFAVLLPCLLIVGCGAAEPVPAQPTYVDDVEPILRANCFGCHGAGPRVAGAGRWDLFSKDDDRWGILTGTLDGAANQSMKAVSFYAYASSKDSSRMPPAPATRLSDRDIEVLKRWNDLPVDRRLRGKRTPNAKPTAGWLDPQKTFYVRDADHDQVLGEIACRDIKKVVDRTGAHTVPAAGPCIVTLYDGQDETPVVIPLRP